MVAGIEQEGGPVDILVNNAGINLKKPALEVTDEEFSRILQTNLHGLFALSREVARGMAARRRGAILNITSMAALYGPAQGAGLQCGQDGGARLDPGPCRGMGAERHPGECDRAGLHPFRHDRSGPQLPIPNASGARSSAPPWDASGTRRRVAAAALFLCSDAASFVTGVNLPVDGGNSIGF